MKLALATAFCIFVLTGCGNTEQGLRKDTSNNGQKAADSAQNLKDGVTEAGKDMGASTILTPKVKSAIVADKRLNEPTNLIDVNSTSDKVTLEGHVTSSDLKRLAGEVASKAMKESNATQTLDNKLTVEAR
ncbi:MAG: BON domain-containing protein [Chthonomonadaceae bacterium]|nr:BON domain-containing protein [Chthonomonadaceae bacterium]